MKKKLYFINSIWNISIYLNKVFFAFITTIFLTNYLSTIQYGIIVYGLNLYLMILSISKLGLDNVLIRDISKRPSLAKEYLPKSFILISSSSFILLLVTLIYVVISESILENIVYIIILLISIIASPFNVISYYFHSKLKSKYVFFTFFLSSIVSLTLKIFFLLNNFNLIYVVFTYLLEVIIGASSLVFFHKKFAKFKLIKKTTFTGILEIYNKTKIYIPIAITAIIYSKISYIFLRHFNNLESVAIYDIAGKFYDLWTGFVFIVLNSLVPFLVNSKKKSEQIFHRDLQFLYTVFLWLSILVSIFFTLFGREILIFIFGINYSSSYLTMCILLWSSCITSIWIANARYLVINHMEKEILKRTFLGMIINIGLNLILIPYFGIIGAAISQFITLFFITYLINFFNKEHLEILRFQHNSLKLKNLYLIKNVFEVSKIFNIKSKINKI